MQLIKLLTWDEDSACLATHWCSQNPYLVIDAETYGVVGQNVDAWKIVNRSKDTSVLIYRYYNSFQLLSDGKIAPDGLNLILDLLDEQNPEMVQGPRALLEDIAEGAKRYRLSAGRLYEFQEGDAPLAEGVELASGSDFMEIAELICADEKIGSHYSQELLASQFAERAQLQGCKNMILRRNGRIAAHMATYGESNELAVLGGLKSGNGSKKGDGSLVLDALARTVIRSKKRAFLYCYIEPLWSWYEARGWKCVANIAKLEL